ncbi:MAG: hypothetical protein ACAI34_20245, partial [Verrucomicrobium sp.]
MYFFRLTSSHGLLIALLLSSIGAFPALADKASPTTVMKDQHRSLLKEYCQNCHGAEKQKGHVRLDDLPFTITDVQSA